MNIVVFIKQVPDNTKLSPDSISGNAIPTDGVAMMMNPYDEYALETALKLKESAGNDATVTVMSLGSASAKDIVKKAVAAGADDAFILSDPTLLEGDSTTTAYALAEATKTLVPDHQVLVFGQMSLDDAVAQTGPKVAELLDYPSLTACKGATLNDGKIRALRETERGIETHDMELPGVVCMIKCDYELRTANIKGVMRANKTQIPVKSASDLGLDNTKIGSDGATTIINTLGPRPPKDAGLMIQEDDPKAAVDKLLSTLKSQKVL